MNGSQFLVLYIAGFGAMTTSLFLSLNTSTYSDAGGSRYERKRARRTAAITLFVISLVLIFWAVIVQNDGTLH
jgi:hypothetical protein